MQSLPQEPRPEEYQKEPLLLPLSNIELFLGFLFSLLPDYPYLETTIFAALRGPPNPSSFTLTASWISQ